MCREQLELRDRRMTDGFMGSTDPGPNPSAQSSTARRLFRSAGLPLLFMMVASTPVWTWNVAAAQRGEVVPLGEQDGEALAPQGDRERIGAWLGYAAKEARRRRRLVGIGQTVLGSVALTTAIVFYTSSAAPSGLERNVLAGLMAASGLNTTLGIVALAKKSDPELRFERWLVANTSRLTLRELARFEGELRNDSKRASRAVLANRWTSLGLALTGGLILGLTPAADFADDSRALGYVAGGVGLGVGLLGFALSFGGSPETNYWNAYQEGKRPPAARRVRATATIAQGFGGVRIVGRF